jgi:hypothetical protein
MISRFVLPALLPILVSGPVAVQSTPQPQANQIAPQATKNPPQATPDPLPINQPPQPNPTATPATDPPPQPNKNPQPPVPDHPQPINQSAPPPANPAITPINKPADPPPVNQPQQQANPGPLPANQQWLTFDTTELELIERAATRKTTELKIPVRLDATDVRVLGWRVNQFGRPHDPSAVRFELQEGDGRYATLVATFDLSQLQDAGTYAANIDFHGIPGRPAQARVASPLPIAPGATVPPPAPRQPAEQTVQFKITKPAAELRISTPLKVERVVYLPWFYSALEPSTLTLNETAGKAWLAPNPSTWRVVLRKGEDTPEANALTVVLPQTVDGWGQAEAKVALEGPIGIGTTSGTLTVRSPQLATHTADFPITVVSRFAAFWVLLVIAVGIFFGWLFRNVLERKRGRLEATIPAENEISSLDVLVDKANDRGIKQALQSAKDTLMAVLDNDRSTPDAIKTATTAAATERQRIVKDADDRTNAARKTLQTWDWVTTLPDPLPQAVRTTTDDLHQRVADWQVALDERKIGEVEMAIQHALPDGAQRIRGTIDAWLRPLMAMTTKPWVDVPSLSSVADIKADASSLRTAVPAAVAPELLRYALVTTADLLAAVRAKLFERGAGDAKRVAETIREDVVKRWRQLDSEVAEIDAALKQIPEPAAAETALGAETLCIALDSLWSAVHDLLKAAWANEKQPLPGLDEGHFNEALKAALASKSKDRALGSTGPVAPADLELDRLVRELASRPLSEPPRVLPTWTMTLEAADAALGRPVAVQVRVMIPPGQLAPQLQIEWFRDGRLEELSSVGVLRREFIFTRPGQTVIEATGIDRAGSQVTARLTISIARRHGAAALTGLQRVLSKVEHLQTWIAGAIITGAGWIMFSPSFVGTVHEFFAAFLWGFTVDVGAAKLLELGKSVSERKLTLQG